jgi:hypothetical protein
MKFIYKQEFLKTFDKCAKQLQEKILDSIQHVTTFYETQKAAFGLRIKKIGPNTFEARVSDKIRIVWIKDSFNIYFSLIGNHNEVRRFIKQLY